ncbi:hypothetical protein B4O97_18575 [Marispirochaeta aestuarii]|uniref:DUF4349 domain-containing protein n=1 Tax=Marispirochaeta aestuarii TaxID=1963862 RepID=A0A1Y1RT11_9SPIO|nr:hypothetical protein [Marispirochaeta aestuarii]ORC29917.1 hypothetical protein B4O97_18575 [Marispirochaeta aestuarii]
MKILISVILCIGILTSIFSQQNDYNEYFAKKAQLHILVNDIDLANKRINGIISELSLKVDAINIDNQRLVSEYTLVTDKEKLDSLIQRFENLGSIDLKNIETRNNINDLEANAFEVEYLESRKLKYQQALEQVDPEADSETYRSLWNEIRETEEQLYQKRKTEMELRDDVQNSTLVFKVSEKTVQYLNDQGDFPDFINMPGLETFLYVIENPEKEISADIYAGGALRYMFTMGKSFFTVGILKPLRGRDRDIQGQANDIVTYSIGKDFYPRYLGQGKRTYFNPYSGFQLGGMVLTSEEEITHFFTAEPHLGLEIFKNKYIIVDFRLGYLFPLDEEKVKVMRGLTNNFSVNIVF